MNVTLPELHPGTPPSMKASADLIIRKETERAYLVQLPSAEAVKSVWLPKSQASFRNVHAGSVLRSDVPAGQRYWFEIVRFDVPVWLYNKIREQLQRERRKP